MPGYADPAHNDFISVIEDLDPESAPSWRQSRKKEMLLGVLLLAGVVLFAVGQWQSQDYAANQYRQGQEAVERHDWDAAAQYFHQAGEYNDAARQESNAREQIRQRDSLYQSGLMYADKGEWLHALSDFQVVSRIQPDYLDVTSMVKKASQPIYNDAMAGAVVIRENAYPRGLYYRDPEDWVWLKDSDQDSRWEINRQRDHIVFDIQREDAVQDPSPFNRYSDYNWARLFMDSYFDGTRFHYTALQVDTGKQRRLYTAEDGLWTVDSEGELVPADYLDVVQDPFLSSKFAYQPYSSPISYTVEAGNSSTSSVIAFIDPDSNRYLLAEWNNEEFYIRGQETAVNIYLCAAGESQERPVYTHKNGSVQSAQLSPNGRYVVVTASTAIDGFRSMLTTTLTDTEGNAPPRIIKSVLRYNNSSDARFLSSAFVRRGVLAGKLILIERGREGTQVNLIDPAQATGGAQAYYTDMLTILPGNIDASWHIQEQNDKGVVLTAQTYEGDQYSGEPAHSVLHAVVLPAGGLPEQYSVEIEQLFSVHITRDQFIWVDTLDERGPTKSARTYTVHTMSRSATGNNPQEPATILTIRDADPSGSQEIVQFGENSIAYTVDKELHARTFDGEVDVVLETGVSSINRDLYRDPYVDPLR